MAKKPVKARKNRNDNMLVDALSGTVSILAGKSSSEIKKSKEKQRGTLIDLKARRNAKGRAAAGGPRAAKVPKLPKIRD